MVICIGQSPEAREESSQKRLAVAIWQIMDCDPCKTSVDHLKERRTKNFRRSSYREEPKMKEAHIEYSVVVLSDRILWSYSVLSVVFDCKSALAFDDDVLQRPAISSKEQYTFSKNISSKTFVDRESLEQVSIFWKHYFGNETFLMRVCFVTESNGKIHWILNGIIE